MAEVFISYSSKNKDVADAVCAKLEHQGISCWIAPRNILPGREWSEAIIEGIADCQVMVVIFSAHANRSQQVRREVERASDKGAVVLPFGIENAPTSRTMETYLSPSRWIDASVPPLETHLQRLVEATQTLLHDHPTAKTTLRFPATAHTVNSVAPPPTSGLAAIGAGIAPMAQPETFPAAPEFAEAIPHKVAIGSDVPRRNAKPEPTTTEVPEAIQGFNVGAFLLTRRWLSAHQVPLFLGANVLAALPCFGWISGLMWSFRLWWVLALFVLGVPVWIYAALNGNALAWRQGDWSASDADTFEREQQQWARRGAITWLVVAVISFGFVRSGWNVRVGEVIEKLALQNPVSLGLRQQLQRDKR